MTTLTPAEAAYNPFDDNSDFVVVGGAQMRIGYVAHCLGVTPAALARIREGWVVVPREHSDPDALKDLVWDAINDAEGYPTMRQMQPLWAAMLAAVEAARHD